jgi:hypothetical protein
MDDLISINRNGVFTLEQARQILPIVRRITQELSERVDDQITELESTPNHQKKVIAALEADINKLIQLWNEKIKKLGAIPKGLWLVDFDFGRGYYCWKYPETDLLHWHTRDEGFSGRRPLEEKGFEKQNERSSNRSRSDQFPPRGL